MEIVGKIISVAYIRYWFILIVATVKVDLVRKWVRFKTLVLRVSLNCVFNWLKKQRHKNVAQQIKHLIIAFAGWYSGNGKTISTAKNCHSHWFLPSSVKAGTFHYNYSEQAVENRLYGAAFPTYKLQLNVTFLLKFYNRSGLSQRVSQDNFWNNKERIEKKSVKKFFYNSWEP